MKTPKTFPHKVESLKPWGGVIYKSASRGNTYFKLVYRPDGKGAARKTLGFDSIDATMKEIGDLVTKMGKRTDGAIVLANGQAAQYQQSMELLSTLPNPPALNIAIARYVEWANAIGEDVVPEAVKFYARTHPKKLPDKTVRNVVDEFIADAEKRKLSERYVETLRHYCGKFADNFNTRIVAVTAAQIREFLDALKVAPRSRNNFLGSIRTLFSFAAEREYLPIGFDQHDRVKFVADGEGEIEVYTADEVKRLLAAASDELKPCIAIGAFAGLRSAEIERLSWRDIKLDQGCILVREKSHSGQRNKTGKRTVPITDNLKAWLAPVAKSDGLIWKLGHDCYYHAQREAAAATKTEKLDPVAWKHNGLRHSYISYRVQQTQNLPQVALEAGNSPQIINKHYREVELPDGKLITAKEAAEWFSITGA